MDLSVQVTRVNEIAMEGYVEGVVQGQNLGIQNIYLEALIRGREAGEEG